MSCKIVARICLGVGERKPYGFNLTGFCARYWRVGEVHALAERVRPRELLDGGKGPTSFEYEATVAGQTKVREPDWPMTLGGTVTDGEVVWTARSISNASLVKTITASNWAAETGVSIEGEATENSAGEQKTAAFLIAESAGKKLSVVNTVTFSDTHKEQFRLEVTVE